MNDFNTSTLFSTLLTMGSFALVGAITPGPVNVLALRHGSQNGHRCALWYVLGASVSYVAVVACTGLGSAQLLQSLPAWAGATQWLCAAYLLWLAWRLAAAPVDASPAAKHAAHEHLSARQAFVQGLAVQTLNPKAWLFALSAVGIFALPQGSHMHRYLALLCSISLMACMLGVGCWAVAGRALMQWLNTPQRQQRLHHVLALLLVASTLAMLA